MKPRYVELAQLLEAISQAEAKAQGAFTPVHEIQYLPMGGEDQRTTNSHWVGYHFFKEIPEEKARVVTVGYVTGPRTWEVCVGRAGAFKAADGRASWPRTIRKDSVSDQEQISQPDGVTKSLTNSDGEDTSLRFIFSLKETESVAKLVTAFLIHLEIPSTLNYL